MTFLHVVRVPGELSAIARFANELSEVAVAREVTVAIAGALADLTSIEVLVEVSSSAARTIVDHVRSGSFDMVVLGKRAHPPGCALGSATVEYVMRHAPSPVLTMAMSVR